MAKKIDASQKRRKVGDLRNQIGQLNDRRAEFLEAATTAEASAEELAGTLEQAAEADRPAIEKTIAEHQSKAKDAWAQAAKLAAEIVTKQNQVATEEESLRQVDEHNAAVDRAEQSQGRSVGVTGVTEAEGPAQANTLAGRIAQLSRGVSLRSFRGEVNGVSANERAYRFGMWVLARVSQDMPGRFNFASAKQFVADQFALRQASHTTSDQSTGSHVLIPEEFGSDLINLRESYGVVRRLFKIRLMSSDTRTDPRRIGGLTPYFVADGQAGTSSTKQWDKVRLTAKNLMVLSAYTNQLSESAVISIGDDLAGEISYAFANKEDECGFNGDGTSTYGHIQGVRHKLQNLDTAGTDSAGLVIGAGTTWSALTLANFDSVVGLLPEYADTPNAAWVMHRAFYYGVVEKLIQASGGVPAMEVREGRRSVPLFKGYPVVFSQVFPSTTAVASVVATLGDYGLGASFGDRGGEQISFSDSATIGGQSVFENDEMAIRGVERFDINVHDVGSSSAAGPIVGLQTAAS